MPSSSIMALFYMPTGYGCEYDGGVAAQVLSNANYLHPEYAYNTDSLYGLFEHFGGLGSWSSQIHLDVGQTYDDVSALLMCGYRETLDTGTVTRWGYGLAASTLGEQDLEATIRALRAAFIVSCQPECFIDVDGDVNTSGSVTSADIIYLSGYVFRGQASPEPCAANGDVDCQGTVNSADIIYLVNFVFKGRTPPCDICAGSPMPCE